MRATIKVTRLRATANNCPSWFLQTQTLQDILTIQRWLIPCNTSVTLSEFADAIVKHYGYSNYPTEIKFEVDFLRFLEKMQEIKNDNYGIIFMWAFLENWRYPYGDEPKKPFYDSANYLVFGDGGKVNRVFHLLDKEDAVDWAREMSREHRGGSVSLSYVSAIWNVKRSRPVYSEAVLGWYRNGKKEY